MAFSRFSVSKVTSSNLFFINILRLNSLIPVVPPSAATDRLFHATAPTSDSDDKISGDHLRTTFKTFRFVKHPYQTQGPMEPCDLKEDANALFIRLDMPGISKEGLKLWYENESLYITGEEGEKESLYITGEKDEAFLQELVQEQGMLEELLRRKFSTSLSVSPRRFKTDQIKASLKNGVLKVVIPKYIHREGNNDVVRIEIE